jgi:hypothetical protein
MPRKKHIPKQLRQKVAKAANHRCGYCLFPQNLMGMPLTIEHIQPEAAGGATSEENLWLAAAAVTTARGRAQRVLIRKRDRNNLCSIHVNKIGGSILPGVKMGRR